MEHMIENIEIVKWQGIKNGDTKTVEQGYLFIKFAQPTTLLNINPNTVGAEPHEYKTGQTIGFSIKAKNRRQAIDKFFLDNQIVH